MTMTAPPNSTSRKSGLSLDEAKVVLVRFHFSNPDAMPAGLLMVESKPEQDRLAKLMAQMKTSDPNAIRGYEAINNVKRAQVALLRTGLVNNGLRLTDSHVTISRKPGKPVSNIVVLAHRRLEEGESAVEIPHLAKEGLRELATKEVWIAHGWWNPNLVFVIDLVAPHRMDPLHALVVRNGWIVAEATERKLREDEENREVARETLEVLLSMK